MWRLLRAEFSYNTQVFLFILLTSLLGFLGVHFLIDDILSWIFRSPASALLWLITGIGSAVIVLSLSRIKSYAQ